MGKNKEGTGYDYVGCHTDDITIVSNAAREIMNDIMDHYDAKKAGKPVYHLGIDYKLVHHQGAERWQIGSVTHVKEAIIKFEDLLSSYFGDQGTKGKYTLPKFTSREKKVLVSNGSHPEMDDSELLDAKGHRLYQQLLGIMQWLCTIGRGDIQ